MSNLLYTVKNKKYSNAEYWGKIPGIFKLFYRYFKMENVQNISTIPSIFCAREVIRIFENFQHFSDPE